MSGFTPQQRRAIALRGNVLVVAGAGTGKTRTLVQRCLEWLLEAPGQHSLERVLMVTFTEAAAAEMRRRIRDELKTYWDQHRTRSDLQEQLALLDTALIGTLHSFCYRLVREHFYQLELDPSLTVLPEEEAQLLAEETLSALLEQHYAGGTAEAEAVQELIQAQARGWEVPIRRLVLRLHHYTQTLPDPGGWLTTQLDVLSAPEPHHWSRWLTSALLQWREVWIAGLRPFASENPNVAACLAALTALCPQGSQREMALALAQIQTAYDRWPRGTIGKIRHRLEGFFAEAAFLRGLVEPCGNPPTAQDPSAPKPTASAPSPLAQDWAWARPHLNTLLELTREFGRRFAQAKREAGLVDFHDLEQFSLRLLWDPVKQAPTSLAADWRRKLDLIFVDEYQDINAAQDAILCALGRAGEEANRFLVGDPKQSIYRFRLADPHIFQGYMQQWQQQPSLGQVLPLNENFRSRKEILDFVNALFAGLMHPEIGGVAYDALARLQYGQAQGHEAPSGHEPGLASAAPAPRPPESANTVERSLPPVELHLLLSGKADADPLASEKGEDEISPLASLNSAEKEARLVGLRLRELRQSLIWDRPTREHRPVQWGDMVILLRSPSRKVEAYAKEFSRLGIPLISTRSGFFESLAVTDLLSLLSLLDNPLQDLPLLAVLRSPLAGLSYDELAVIRLAAPGRFWFALQQFRRSFGPDASTRSVPPAQSGSGDPKADRQRALHDPSLRDTVRAAWDKADLFLRRYAEWRRWARQISLTECLERILDTTQYPALLLAQVRGPEHCANVSKLLTWARQFDRSQRRGLYRFLRFVEAQKEAQIDHEPAPLAVQDGVRLMSIHQSKGLEFGIVVVADLGKPFNLADLRSELILDEEFGICPLIKPPSSEQRYPSLPYWLAQRRQRRELLGEEMRLLYVGLTRACQCLILTGTTRRSATERWANPAGTPLGAGLVSARNYLDWLGPWLGKALNCPDWAKRSSGRADLLRWTLYEPEDPRLRVSTAEPARAIDPMPDPANSAAAETDAVLERLKWRYPFQEAVQQLAKLSVSSIRVGLVAQSEEAPRPFRTPPSAARPAGHLSAAAVGNAHHTFLQFVSFDHLQDLAALEAEAERLERAGLLSAAERRELDLEAVASFWHSQVGQEIFARRDWVHRELSFTSKLSLATFRRFQERELAALSTTPLPSSHGLETPALPAAEAEDDFVVVTGVVDLAVLLPGEIWLLDFKTDAVKPSAWEAKAKVYEPQLLLYALALSRIYARPVTRAWLHSLPLGRSLLCSCAPLNI